MLTCRRRIEDERGVTLILMAALMVALLAIAGLVLDIGLVRADRQRNKGVADVAVSAGMRASAIGGSIATFQGACAALDYLKANHPELISLSLTSGWTKGDGTTAITGSGNPCDSSSAAYAANYGTLCNPATTTTAELTSAWFTGSTGTLDVTVKAGYSNLAMSSDGFREDIYHTDAGDPDYNGCDQLAVIVTERETAGFGKAVGGGQLSSTIRSVGRFGFDDESESAVALLLIEPTGCEVLKIGGAGSGVTVKGTDTRPGIIHADSTGAGCGGSNRVLTGHHVNGIVAERAPNPPGSGTAGIVSVNTVIPNPAYDDPTYVVAQGGAPQMNGPKGRTPVDQRYLGVGTAYGMIDLRAAALTRFAWTTTTVPADYAVVTGGACNFSALPGGIYTPPAGKTKVFINCDLDKSVTFADSVTDVVVNGSMNLNGKTVVMPNVRNVFVEGTMSPTRGVDINSGGILSLNRSTYGSCAAREAALQAAGDTTSTTRLVIGAGPLSVGSGSSTFQGCWTTVFLMGNAGSFPASNGTAPADNGYNGSVNVGSSGRLDWSAPNTRTVASVAADWERFEDLALWTETSGGNSISGNNASMTLKGIFFTPNANYFDVSAGSGGITADAQFITRKLNNQGGGTLSLTADPNNSVPYKIVSGYNLVR